RRAALHPRTAERSSTCRRRSARPGPPCRRGRRRARRRRTRFGCRGAWRPNRAESRGPDLGRQAGGAPESTQSRGCSKRKGASLGTRLFSCGDRLAQLTVTLSRQSAETLCAAVSLPLTCTTMALMGLPAENAGLIAPPVQHSLVKLAHGIA